MDSLLLLFFLHFLKLVMQSFKSKKCRIQTRELNTFIHTNFRFKRMLDAGKALMWVKNIADFGRFWYLNIPCLRIILL